LNPKSPGTRRCLGGEPAPAVARRERAFHDPRDLFTELSSCKFMANAGRPYDRAGTRPVPLDDVRKVADAYTCDYLGSPGIRRHLAAANQACRDKAVRHHFVRSLVSALVFGSYNPVVRRHRRQAWRVMRAWGLRSGERPLRYVNWLVVDLFSTVAALIETGQLDRFPMLRLAAEAVLDGHVPGEIERSPGGDTLQVH
jgi:hypothetical protein